jgi:hypothetical protein
MIRRLVELRQALFFKQLRALDQLQPGIGMREVSLLAALHAIRFSLYAVLLSPEKPTSH